MKSVKEFDSEIYDACELELRRQRDHIEMIASENFVSAAVMEAQGSVLTNKYAEGYPSKRYYGGCFAVDVVENLAKERLNKLFGSKFCNVQPHSGSQANMAATRSLINIGDKILGMNLSEGGHLTHGHHLNFSGKDYEIVTYGVDENSEMIDYNKVEQIALKEKPQLIIAGASAYPRKIDFERFREIADKVGAYLMVDMAHIAGLVASGLHQSPMPYAHLVTSTTHKTLRGPRGGIILTNDEELAKKIDREVFPGTQGGPLMHVICAKAVSFKEALEDSFIEYQKQVIKNSEVLASELKTLGFRIISGGTDNHLVLVDVKSFNGITGKDAERVLDSVNITCNKNTIPNDTEKPFISSGIRLGTPAITTRGFKEDEIKRVANLIYRALKNYDDEIELNKVKKEVLALTSEFQLY